MAVHKLCKPSQSTILVLTSITMRVYTLLLMLVVKGVYVVDAQALTNCTCLNLRKAARAVTKMYDEVLKPSGLRSTQLSLLAIIENSGPSGVNELAEALVTDRTTLTRNLKPLLKLELLKVVEGDDRRRRPIAITSTGQDVLVKALPMWRKVQEQMIGNLGSRRWESLIGDLGATVNQAQHG